MGALINLEGERLGADGCLEVLHRDTEKPGNEVFWRVYCHQCNTEHTMKSSTLRMAKTCGCEVTEPAPDPNAQPDPAAADPEHLGLAGLMIWFRCNCGKVRMGLQHAPDAPSCKECDLMADNSARRNSLLLHFNEVALLILVFAPLYVFFAGSKASRSIIGLAFGVGILSLVIGIVMERIRP